MAIPLIYSVRSLRLRWVSSVVAVLGIAGTVGVFVAMLSLARGFKATLVGSGSAQNAMVRRGGSNSEMVGVVTRGPGATLCWTLPASRAGRADRWAARKWS